MIPALFIGGPKDGEHICVDDGKEGIEAVECRPAPLLVEEFIAEEIKYQIILYTARPFFANNRRFMLFAPEAMPSDHVIDRLIAGYKPQIMKGKP